MAKRPFLSFNAFQYRDRFECYSSRIFNNSGNQRPFDVSVDPPALYFGTVAVGEQSATQRAVVTNVGYRAVPIKSVMGVGDFVVSSEHPQMLEPGETFLVAAMFAPQRGGASSGGIYVDTGDAAGREFVMLMGAGEGDGGTVTPGTGYTLSRSSIAFGSVQVDEDSTVQSITITNSGSTALTIGLSVTGMFTLDKASVTVPANGTATFAVTFSPTSAGAKTGAVTLSTTASGPKSVALTGTGSSSALPIISVAFIGIEEVSDTSSVSSNVTSLAFGAVSVGETSTERSIILTNSGGVAASITALSATGDFAITSGAIGQTIPASGSRVIKVAFTPSGAGAAVGTVSIETDADVGTSFSVSLSGSGSAVVVPTTPRLKIIGNQFVTEEDETPVRLHSVNWFGAEGTNFTPHGTWAVRWTDILDDIAAMGFNCIRFPFSGDLTTPNRAIPTTAFDADLNPEFVGKTALQVCDLIFDYCETKGLYVVLDHHRRVAGNGTDGWPVDGSYTQANWLAAWAVMTARYKDHPVIVGADVHNEPHDGNWTAWAPLAEAAGNSIIAAAPKWLIFVQGVGQNLDSTSYWWGGALKDVATRPITLNVASKVVYSPHEYGQSVGSQQWLSKDGTNVPNYPNNLYAVWDANWGFIFKNNIAPIWIGEFGGFFGVDGNGAATKPNGTEESQWVTTLGKYLNGDFNGDGTNDLTGGKKGMSFAYWGYNPNSGDTGGLVRDDWTTHQNVKLTLIAPMLAV